YYNLPVKSVLIYGQTDFMKYGWMGSFLLISFFGTLISIRRLGQVKLSHLITPITEPEVLTIRKAIIYPLNEYLELDVERGLLKTDDGREVELKIIMVQLFEELLISPYYHAFDKDIRLRIWGQEEEPSNVLTQLISRTREAIKPIKELEIRNIRKRGYQLIIHPKGQSWDLLPEDPSPIVMNGILEEE
ncbi:MAG: winged helix-turn-helix domain-containing protein, partial [Tannerellaceae bacterium]|nr:winged helix-turn-helix domain-containing protein [Tannerellaceae bacterium]